MTIHLLWIGAKIGTDWVSNDRHDSIPEMQIEVFLSRRGNQRKIGTLRNRREREGRSQNAIFEKPPRPVEMPLTQGISPPFALLGKRNYP